MGETRLNVPGRITSRNVSVPRAMPNTSCNRIGVSTRPPMYAMLSRK
jgi:hypothetical protein